MTNLDAKVTPIHVISQEQISGLGRITSDLKKFHQVKVLTMDVATDGNRGVHLQQIRLCTEDFCASVDNPQRLIFSETALSIEMLFEELEVRFRGISRGKELLLRRRMKGWCLDI